MTQYPGGQPPYDPYYGQPPGDPYAPPPASDPYLRQGGDPYAPPPADADYAAQQQAWYAQQQAWYAQQQAAYARRQGAERRRGRGGAGAAVVGILLVLVGVWILFGDEIDVNLGQVWPVAAVAIGVLMVIGAFIPRGDD